MRIGTIWNSICMRMTRAQAQRLNSQCASLHWSATHAQLQRQPNSKHHYIKNPNSITFNQFYLIYLTPFCLALLWASLPVAWLLYCFGFDSLHRPSLVTLAQAVCCAKLHLNFQVLLVKFSLEASGMLVGRWSIKVSSGWARVIGRVL